MREFLSSATKIANHLKVAERKRQLRAVYSYFAVCIMVFLLLHAILREIAK